MLNKETNNYLNDYCSEFVNEHITDPVLELGKEQLIDFLQGYLKSKGYAKDRADAILSMVTGNSGTDITKYLTDYGNNEFAAKIANLDIFNKVDNALDFFEKGEAVHNLLKNGINMSSYSTQDMQTEEYKRLLKEQLDVVLGLTCDLMEYIPGGTMYSSSIPELQNAIDETIRAGLNYNKRTNVYDVATTLFNNRMPRYIEEWANGYIYTGDIRNNYWVKGPTLDQLQEIYNNYPEEKTSIFNEYLEWRIAYELRQAVYSDLENGFKELSDSEKKGLQEFEDYYSTTHIEITDSSSSSTITGDTNDNGSSDGDLTKTDDDENDSDPLSGDIIEQFSDIKNEINMPPKSRLTFWGHNHMLMFLSVDSRNSGDSFLENVENYSCGVERSENRHAVLYRAAAYRNAVVIVNS